MSSSMSLEEKIESLAKLIQDELTATNAYLKKQLGENVKQKQKMQGSGGMRIEEPSEQPRRMRVEDEEEMNQDLFECEEEIPFMRAIRESRPTSNLGDFKVEIPEFEGKLDPDEFIEWLQTVERVFEFREIPEDKKVKLVALRLRKYASLWWTNLNAKRTRERKGKITTWDKLKSKMKARFLPSTYVQEQYALFHHFNLGKMNVEEYTREFEKLVIKCDIHEPEEQTIVRYLGGLDPRIANVVELQAYTSFDEICVLAHKVEQQRKSRTIFRNSFEPHLTFPQEQPNDKGSPTIEPKSMTPPFPTPQKSLTPQIQPKRGTPRCFKCQGFGHIAADCVNRKVITLAEWEAIREKEKEEEDEDELEEIIVCADEGDMLTFDTPHPPKDTERRTILFMSFGEPLHLPAPPTPQPLTKKFCHPIPGPFLLDLNFELRTFKKVVRSLIPNSPRSIIPIRKGKNKQRIYKAKQALFAWLILFQPSIDTLIFEQ